MRGMSTRGATLVAILVVAATGWWIASGRIKPAAVTAGSPPTLVHWVATARQHGIVGYRDPAVALAPGGRLIAYSEGRLLRVAPVGGGVDVSAARGEGQIRHLLWTDDRRVVFEDGGAAERWRLHEIGGSTRALWPTTELSGSGASAGLTLRANSLRQLAVSADGAWLAGVVSGREGPEVWRVRLDGQELARVPITTGRPSWPAWTPSG